VWVCVCLGFVMCVLVICLLVYNVFCIVCTVLFVLFRLCIFILICFVCTSSGLLPPSDNSIAVSNILLLLLLLLRRSTFTGMYVNHICIHVQSNNSRLLLHITSFTLVSSLERCTPGAQIFSKKFGAMSKF